MQNIGSSQFYNIDFSEHFVLYLVLSEFLLLAEETVAADTHVELHVFFMSLSASFMLSAKHISNGGRRGKEMDLCITECWHKMNSGAFLSFS